MKPKTQEVHTITARLDKKTYGQLCDLAQKRQLSQNALIAQLIDTSWKLDLPEKWEESLIEERKRIDDTLKALKRMGAPLSLPGERRDGKK